MHSFSPLFCENQVVLLRWTHFVGVLEALSFMTSMHLKSYQRSEGRGACKHSNLMLFGWLALLKIGLLKGDSFF